MSTNQYEFTESLAQGERDEDFLDSYFSEWYQVRKVSMTAQKMGIDRVFIKKDNGMRFTVEYKSDVTAAKTGNAFIETVSIDQNNTPGWAYTSCAQLIAYYVPPLNIIYLLDTMLLKATLINWVNLYQIKKVRNNGYMTHGIPVPFHEIEKCCYGKLSEIRRQIKPEYF